MAWAGNFSSEVLSSCRHATSGRKSWSHRKSTGRRPLTPFTLKVAIFIVVSREVLGKPYRAIYVARSWVLRRQADSVSVRSGSDGFSACFDMQRMFAEPTPWQTPWLCQLLPNVVRLVEGKPERAIFTRFVPPANAEDVPGTWQRYYRRWDVMTLRRLDPSMVDVCRHSRGRPHLLR